MPRETPMLLARVRNALAAEGMPDDPAAWSRLRPIELMRIPNIGRRMIDVLRAHLESLGFDMRSWKDLPPPMHRVTPCPAKRWTAERRQIAKLAIRVAGGSYRPTRTYRGCKLGYRIVEGVAWFRIRRDRQIVPVTLGGLSRDELDAYVDLARELGDADFARRLPVEWLATAPAVQTSVPSRPRKPSKQERHANYLRGLRVDERFQLLTTTSTMTRCAYCMGRRVIVEFGVSRPCPGCNGDPPNPAAQPSARVAA